MKKWLLLVMLSVLATTVWADPKIETIQLKHRLAEELLPQVEPFIGKQDTIKAYGDLLIIKAEPETIEQVKSLVTKLDVAEKSIVVNVMKTDRRLGTAQGNNLQADIDLNNSDNSSVEYQHWSTRDSKDQDQHYRARGISGRPVMIMMGQDIPQQQNLVLLRPNGDIAVQGDTQYLNLNSGFQAVATLLPNERVRVEIHPAFSDYNPQDKTISHSAVISTVEGKLGQWLELGGVVEQNRQETDTIHYRTQHQQQQYLYIKIELNQK